MTTLRPIVAQDGEAFQAFVRGLSMQARLNRFLFPLKELGPSSLAALTQADQSRHVGLIALEGEVLRSNAAMLEFMRRKGFRMKSCPGDARLVIAERVLSAPAIGSNGTTTVPSLAAGNTLQH